MTSQILDAAQRHVSALFQARLPDGCRYHTLDHTREVAGACLEIGRAHGLSAAELEVLQLAGWFHDTGYTEVRDGHEQVSVRIAGEFLAGSGLPAGTVAAVARCIMATHYPQQPRSLLEEVICDADLVYLGRDRYTEQSDALREEWARTAGLSYSDEEWLDSNIAFLTGRVYHTPYARSRYGLAQRRNLENLVALRR